MPLYSYKLRNNFPIEMIPVGYKTSVYLEIIGLQKMAEICFLPPGDTG
jgi:hypothetical protein